MTTDSQWKNVYTYTTRDAVNDGVLVRLDSDAEVGEVIRPFFNLPVYVTVGLAEHVAMVVAGSQGVCDAKGIWHDIGWMAWNAIKRTPHGERKTYFQVALWENDRHQIYDLVVGCAPFDDSPNSQPVVTICFTSED